MDRSEVITLLAASRTQNDKGVWIETLTGRDVFCQCDSVTRAEFYEAGRNGLNPEFRFTMMNAEYNGEQLVQYKGQTYSVYRTYHARTDILELYVERKGGSNGKESAG